VLVGCCQLWLSEGVEWSGVEWSEAPLARVRAPLYS
jgi:hypothetical protein